MGNPPRQAPTQASPRLLGSWPSAPGVSVQLLGLRDLQVLPRRRDGAEAAPGARRRGGGGGAGGERRGRGGWGGGGFMRVLGAGGGRFWR